MSRRKLRSLLVVPAALGALLAIPASTRAQEATVSVVDPTATPPWMVGFEASNDYRVGLDEDALQTWVHKTLKSKWASDKNTKEEFKTVWENSILLQTPVTKVDLPAFALARHEVTNAQWERFLQHREAVHVTEKDETLETIAITRWRLDANAAGKDIQKAWKTLLARNADVLLPILNAEKKEKWDPAVERAQIRKLPAGLRLKYWRIAPPLYWNDDGTVPDHELKKPIRFISWEEADDFARWAGFHLPTEFEWERAARGKEGRLFPWGNDWDPLKLVWRGFNAAAKAAKKGSELGVKVPGSEEVLSETPCPVEVDDTRTGGATPKEEGEIHHLLGNVTEYTSSRLTKYPGAKDTPNPYMAWDTCLARGGNYDEKRAELLIAPDRNWEGHAGPLSASHKQSGYGIRLAMYPAVPGADLTLFPALRLNEDTTSNSPRNWLPASIGFARGDKKAAAFAGFDPQRTAGILDRRIVPSEPNHAYVTGPASGIAFLPVRAIASEHVKDKGDLEKIFANRDQLSVLGVLVGTEQGGFQVKVGDGDSVKTEVVAFTDERLACNRDVRVTTRERLGALLAMEGPDVVVYSVNDTLQSAARHRTGRIGRLDFPATFEIVKEKGFAPSAVRDGTQVVLTTGVPLLDRTGKPTGQIVRIALRVPWVEEVAPAK